MIGEDLLRYQYKQKYILFDLETEGLNLLTAKPWQLAYLIGEGNDIKSIHEHFIYWEDLNVSPQARIITRFDDDKYLREAKDPKVVHEEFSQYLNNPEYIILGHNILGYDVYIYKLWSKLIGKDARFDFWINRLIDTNCVAKAIKADVRLTKEVSLINWMYRLNNFRKRGIKTKLSILGDEYQITYDKNKLHDAVEDIKLNFNVWNKLKLSIDI